MDKGKSSPNTSTAAERDYRKKFNRQFQTEEADDLKDQEESPDSEWQTNVKDKKLKDQDAKIEKTSGRGKNKRGRFGFIGRHAGSIQNGSAVVFILGVLTFGVWYTSIFAPNIILVNVKEMYTNDLADATTALSTYYWKMMNYKLGHSNCSEKKSIKCKLSTMSRAQKKAFEKQGFFVMGSKVQEDNKDDMQPGNETAESRYQVSAVIPPFYAFPTPIFMGDMLYAYSQISSQTKSLVYSVFNPVSSFFQDARFQQRIYEKYGLTKAPSLSGLTEQQVNQSFDQNMTGGSEGIGTDLRPNTTGGIGLGSLGSLETIGALEAGMLSLSTTNTNSFAGIQCNWYSFGKQVTNNAKSAKAHTIARFAMQYLKAADEIKAGSSQDVVMSTLSSKLTQGTFGGYDSASATDDSMYKHIVYNDLPIPSIYGFLYYLDTFDLIGALLPSWGLIMGSAAAVGQASGVQGSLTMPPGNLNGADRQYCLGGEAEQSHVDIKTDHCQTAAGASSPFGPEAAEAGMEAGWQTCSEPHKDERDGSMKEHGQFIMQPSLKATAQTLSPLVAGVFSVNVMAWANVMSLLFTSQTKGVAASNAIFAGTGEILGDMAMSRGMMPSNAMNMTMYLGQKDKVMKDYEDVAKYNARKSPFDVYNKYSFLGSMAQSVNLTFNDKAPLFSALANLTSVFGGAVKKVNSNAEALYGQQPDTFNPIRLAMCPDPEYWAIMIMADVACNVRYSMGIQELLASPDNVLDYMLKEHPDLTQKNIDELIERQATADPEGDATNVGRMLALAQSAAQMPMIDKTTGRAIPNSEYDKFLQYCVNRQDPWGRSGVHTIRTGLGDDVWRARIADKDQNGQAVSPSDSGDPYQQITVGFYPSVSEGASADQDWYTGKKCTENSEELTNFRAYTMMCSVDGSLAGSVDCTYPDHSDWAGYSDSFYTNNDILYSSWY